MASTSKGGGRQPKFDEPQRPVTVTLPKRTLSALAALDADRARAIVKVVDAALSGNRSGAKLVEVIEVAPGAAVIWWHRVDACAVFPG